MPSLTLTHASNITLSREQELRVRDSLARELLNLSPEDKVKTVKTTFRSPQRSQQKT